LLIKRRSPSENWWIKRTQNQMLYDEIRAKKNMVIDYANLTRESRRRWFITKEYHYIAVLFDTL